MREGEEGGLHLHIITVSMKMLVTLHFDMLKV